MGFWTRVRLPSGPLKSKGSFFCREYSLGSIHYTEREDMIDDLFDQDDREYWQKRIEEAVEEMYDENPQGIDKEELKKVMMETHFGEYAYGIDRKETQREIFTLCILGVIVGGIAIFLANIITKSQRKTVCDILERKGYDEEFAREFARKPPRHMMTTLRLADSLPPNSDIKSEKEKEYILGEKYIFRGFGKEGEAKPEDLIEPPEPIPDGWWKCQHCGKVNAPYVGSCGCGCDKSGNLFR